ncbi:uncharacterized protein LOC133224923 isoform X2 [Neopsephotus bourkii]|uniref:uncharacterized protein LOC133224923 isoform X2 n=1 Tax=Neopsephotus bourkii TaxID=309878 RepID=UPI002AA53947|nr:uncharacterized protein LOC133224923 isoform X2 [Neopsephotus bourkii]
MKTHGRLMDLAHFMQLCFLLLTIASSCPSIAVASDDPAKGTQDSSFGKTNVAVYHCESNVCESSNDKDCAKIGETQNERFSNEVIQLVTSDTHITMCFHQGNKIPEGIYAVFWEKDMGAGHSCGILNYKAFLENGWSNIITEQVRICCETSTNLSVPNHTLRCYTEVLDEEPRKSTANIADNPQYLASEKSNVGIITTITILVLCAAAALAVSCVLQKRNGPVIVLRQTSCEWSEIAVLRR